MIKYVFFYATLTDIGPTLRMLENYEPIKFVETGIRPSPNFEIYFKSSDLPNFSIAEASSSTSCTTYMVSPRDVKNKLHPIRTKDGRKLWSLRNGDNEDSVLLALGGLSRTGALLEGQMATLQGTISAQRLMSRFLSALKRRDFRLLQGCWIGPAALLMLKAGARLTQTEQAPRECDIRWPGA